MGFKTNSSSENALRQSNSKDKQQVCIFCLNQKHVFRHVHLLNAQKTPPSIAGIRFGAGGLKKCAASPIARMQCA
jgi:hypothetical protein